MVTMNTVWDRTTQVISGRFGLLASIAGLLGVVPPVVQAVVVQGRLAPGGAVTPGAVAAFGAGILVTSLVLVVCALWSSLSLTAAASDPAVASVGTALGVGGRRLPVAILLALIAGILAVVAILPAVVILGAGGLDLAALRAGDVARAISPSAATGFAAYLLVVVIVGVWLSTRLFLLNPVLVNERRGIGSLARSFELTRGLSWRILGVLLLFVVVFLVLSLAVGSVVGIVFGLAFGSSPATALVLTRLVSAILSAGFAIVVASFAAQLYRSITGLEAAETFE